MWVGRWHSYICYGPLIHGNTTVLFEGKPVGTPDAGTFWRVISEHNVRSFFTAPTAFRAIKREDPKGACKAKYDLSCLRILFLAGERADPDTIYWAQDVLNVPVIDHWWQTETGWTIAGNPMGIEPLPVKIGSPSVAMPGYDIQILDEDGAVLPQILWAQLQSNFPSHLAPSRRFGTQRSATKHPIWKNSLATMKRATQGSWMTTATSYVMARTDDVINVAGHRLSTGAMEEVLANHPDVVECAVIGVSDSLKAIACRVFMPEQRGEPSS